MRGRLFEYFFPFLFFTFVVPSSINAAATQSGQAEITGEIRDQSAAVIPGAKITLTRVESNQLHASTASAAGVYTFTGLKPGAYTIAVEANGFKVSSAKACKLRPASGCVSTLSYRRVALTKA